MVEFLRKFVNRVIQIRQDNSILITKSINLQLFTFILYGFGVRCNRRRFSVLSPFIEKSTYVVTTYLAWWSFSVIIK